MKSFVYDVRRSLVKGLTIRDLVYLTIIKNGAKTGAEISKELNKGRSKSDQVKMPAINRHLNKLIRSKAVEIKKENPDDERVVSYYPAKKTKALLRTLKG